MVVKKGGTPISAKKKSADEMKKLNEKKKLMVKEESEEEETSEEEEEDDSESGDDHLILDEESDEDNDVAEEEEDDDDDDEEEEEDDDEDDDNEDEDESEEETSPKKQQKSQVKTLAKSSKTPTKQPVSLNLQKSEIKSTKTPNKKKGAIENESPMIIAPKKLGKPSNDLIRTTSPSKQQKDKGFVKSTTEKRKREADDEEGAQKKPRADLPVSPRLSMDQKKQRDLRCLFVRQFPSDTTEDDIKALSSDIISVRIPTKRRKGQKANLFAFVEFASEEKAEENFAVLEKAKIQGQELYVDYVGDKSKKFVPRPGPVRVENKKRLFITGLPHNATMEDIAKSFPNAMSIFMKSVGNNRICNVEFETEAAGEEAHKQNLLLKIKGQPVTVVFAFNNKSNKRKMAKKLKSSQQNRQKSPFTTKQKSDNKKQDDDDDEEESDDDDDDDDDDDESED